MDRQTNKHFIRRLRERFGIRISIKGLLTLRNQILSGKYKKVTQYSSTRATWVVCIKGQWLKVAYEEKDDCFVTAMYLNAGESEQIRAKIREGKKKRKRKRKRRFRKFNIDD